MKKDAAYYVRVYCDYLIAQAYNECIAAVGRTLFEMLVDFSGEIPRGSRYYFDTISGRVDRMASSSEAAGEAVALIELLTERQRFVACAWDLLVGKPWPNEPKRIIRTGKDVAVILGEDYKSFNECRNRALDRINAHLGFLIA